jgi:hypothetical protein
MIDDFLAPPKSAKEIETKALAWRHALGVPNEWAPNVVELLEIRLPKLFRDFALIVSSDRLMGDAEAYTEFNPPHIAVRESVYRLARNGDGRSRMTFAHELGHLVMHPGAAKPRTETSRKSNVRIRAFESAEWQARKFGAYFLLPKHIVIEFESPQALAQSCLVSSQAAEIRFAEVGHIKNETAACVQELMEKINKRIPD